MPNFKTCNTFFNWPPYDIYIYNSHLTYFYCNLPKVECCDVNKQETSWETLSNKTRRLHVFHVPGIDNSR